MSEHPLDHPFNKEIRQIWEEHKNVTILSQALGPNPMTFAWRVIEAWETYRSMNSSINHKNS